MKNTTLNLLKTAHFVRFSISWNFSISNKSPSPLKFRDRESLLTHNTCPHCCYDGTQEEIFLFTVFDNVLGLMWTFFAREFWWTYENIVHTKIFVEMKKVQGNKKVVFVLLIKKGLKVKELKASGNLFVKPYRQIFCWVFDSLIWKLIHFHDFYLHRKKTVKN